MSHSLIGRFRPALSALVLSAVLNGCAERDLYDQQAGIAGVGSMIDSHAFEKIDLVSLLDPEGKIKYSGRDEGEKINAAFDTFITQYPTSTLVTRRNAVQERMLAASNQRCGYFKNYLYASRAGFNFGLGSVATATAAAGAIVSGLASNILAGTAAVFSGVRAEYNQEFFSNLTAQVILEGVDVRRQQVYEQIVLHGQSQSYSKYNVQGAVKDAIYYHSQCSAIVGIQMAADSIELVDDPGLDTANRILAKLKTTDLLMNEQGLKPQEALKLVNTTKQLLEAGTPLSDEAESFEDPLDALKTSLSSISALRQGFTKDTDSGDLNAALTDDQKTALKTALEAAGAHATDWTAKCKDPSVAMSTLLSEKEIAQKQASLPSSTAADLVQANFELEQTRLEAGQLIDKIKHPAALFESYLKAARTLAGETPPKVDEAVAELGKMGGHTPEC